MTSSRWPARAALVVPLAVLAGAMTLLPGSAPPAAAQGLEPWQDCDALVAHHRRELARTVTPWGAGGGFAFGGRAVAEGVAADAAPASAGTLDNTEQSASFDAVGSGPTGTNLQERGVDEPDVVKAVGDLLLVAARGRLQVLRAGDVPELLASVLLGEAAATELLVDGDRVLALGSGWRPPPGGPEPLPVPEPLPEPEPAPLPEPEPLPVDPELPADPVAPPFAEPFDPVTDQPLPLVQPRATLPFASETIAPGTGYVSAVLVDVGDPRRPQVLGSLELDGRYVSARLVDGTVRLVTASSPTLPFSQPVEPWGPAQERASLERNRQAVRDLSAEQVLPAAVRRDATGAVVSRGPAVDCADVHHAAGTPQGTSTLTVTTLRPAGGLAAVDSTAVTSDGDLVYASAGRLYVATSRWGTTSPMGRPVPGGEPTTELHAFDTSAPDRTTYVGTGSVRGYVYGRWALSSHEGHLRVATTLQPPWGGDQVSSSSVTVLAERADGLAEVGRVDGLGPDERIYAVRYFGDLATVVTFRETDPLYVVDLADPTAPRVLGELKIPGFSTYLHPVGDGRLLGIGQDADDNGRTTGFQVSLFDLSDLRAPVQVDRLSLGQGWSAAQEDSRAVSYDPTRQLLAIPFSGNGGRSSALGVRIDGDRLVEAGRLDVGPQWLQRTLLHGGRLLALTEADVVAADPATFARTGAAALAG